jgi:hypothetical protein
VGEQQGHCWPSDVVAGGAGGGGGRGRETTGCAGRVASDSEGCALAGFIYTHTSTTSLRVNLFEPVLLSFWLKSKFLSFIFGL